MDIAAALGLSADHRMLLEQLARWWGLSVQEYCVRCLEVAFIMDGDVLDDQLRIRSRATREARRLVALLKPAFWRVFGARGLYVAPCFEPGPKAARKGVGA